MGEKILTILVLELYSCSHFLRSDHFVSITAENCMCTVKTLQFIAYKSLRSVQRCSGPRGVAACTVHSARVCAQTQSCREVM